MQQNDLYQLLVSTGLDVYLYKADKPVSPCYVVYFRDGTTSRGSDERNFIRNDSYIVEFYSDKRDEENQRKIENVLDSAGINYKTNEIYLQDKSLYMVAFYFDITRKV